MHLRQMNQFFLIIGHRCVELRQILRYVLQICAHFFQKCVRKFRHRLADPGRLSIYGFIILQIYINQPFRQF